MAETLIQYLALETGYKKTEKKTILRRPDDSIVARIEGNKWLANPTQEEVARYTIYSGKGLPSLLYSNKSD